MRYLLLFFLLVVGCGRELKPRDIQLFSPGAITFHEIAPFYTDEDLSALGITQYQPITEAYDLVPESEQDPLPFFLSLDTTKTVYLPLSPKIAVIGRLNIYRNNTHPWVLLKGDKVVNLGGYLTVWGKYLGKYQGIYLGDLDADQAVINEILKIIKDAQANIPNSNMSDVIKKGPNDYQN